jgi:thymidine kinase
VAEDVTKTLAICVRCGSPANNTQRLVESDELVVVGAQGCTRPAAARCYSPLARLKAP